MPSKNTTNAAATVTAATTKTKALKTKAAKKPKVDKKLSASKTTEAVAPTAAPVTATATATATTTATTTPVAPAATDAPAKTELENFNEQFLSLATRLNAFKTVCNELATDLKKLQKDVVRAVKSNGKRKKKILTPEEKLNRKPTGFAKPTVISDELCNFLGKPVGSEMARTEVTKFLSTYIKNHNLQDPVNKKIIKPDKKLKKLLNVKPKDELTYFNLQKYMKVHFKKAGDTTLVSSTPTTA
jgi:chromatin remodeling complex protein RSC6